MRAAKKRITQETKGVMSLFIRRRLGPVWVESCTFLELFLRLDGSYYKGKKPYSETRCKVRSVSNFVDELRGAMLDFLVYFGGAVAQLGARLDGIEEVVGSNPIGSTNFWIFHLAPGTTSESGGQHRSHALSTCRACFQPASFTFSRRNEQPSCRLPRWNKPPPSIPFPRPSQHP